MRLSDYTNKDRILAAFVTVLVLILCAMTLTAGLPYWGDDSAAYISEGIAIANGSLQKQAELNYIMHPSELPEEATPEGLVYVWGYPLVLSGVYNLAGFDRVNYSSVIWYKIPLLLSLSLLAGVQYLFFRRRFSAGVSAVSSLVLCFSENLVENLNYLYSDILFLFFSMLSFLAMELYSEESKSTGMESRVKKRNLFLGLFYGAILWYTYEIRLNGITVCIAASVGHAVSLWKSRNQLKRTNILPCLFPYVVMICLIVVSEQFFLAQATSNMSAVGKAAPEIIGSNIQFYWKQIYNFLNGLPRIKFKYTGYIFAMACITGIFRKGFSLENLYLTLLLFGTLFINITLSYNQGLRYLYNILPIFLMYTVYGLQAAWRRVSSVISFSGKIRAVIMLCAVCTMLLLPLLNIVSDGIDNRKNWGYTGDGDVYSKEAVDMYRYIRENVPEDKIIAFGKPRSLYLNTERISMRTGCNGHTIADADYYLEYESTYHIFAGEKEEAEATPKETIYKNRLFTLYSVNKDRT